MSCLLWPVNSCENIGVASQGARRGVGSMHKTNQLFEQAPPHFYQKAMCKKVEEGHIFGSLGKTWVVMT